MNKRLGIGFSAFSVLATLVCAVCIVLNQNVLLVSCTVPIGYVGVMCSYIVCAEKNKRNVAYTALIFFLLYVSFFLMALIGPTHLYSSPILNMLIAFIWLAISMALLGASIKSRNKSDKWLKRLLYSFGTIFIVSIIVIFEKSISPIFYGTRLIIDILTEICIAYFLAICVLSLVHFIRMPKPDKVNDLPPQDMKNDEA